jgi:hypothetical protein
MTMRVRERLWAGCVGSVLPPLCPAHSKATPNTLTRPRCCAGAPVTPFEHNWVILFRTGGYVCGASLIDEQWAMTAAHCTKGVAASSMQVGVHRHAYGWADNGEHDCAETVAIAEKHEHPEYDSGTLENDITLLRLSQVHPLPHALANSRRVPPMTIFALALPPDLPSSRSRRRLMCRSRASCRSRSAAPTPSPCPRSTTAATAAPARL